SLGLAAGAGGRRTPRAARRSQSRASRRALPRRAAGVPARDPRGATPTPGERPRHGGARQRPCELSRPRADGRGDESLPLRTSRRRLAGLRPRAALRAGLSVADLRYYGASVGSFSTPRRLQPEGVLGWF